MFGSGSNKYAQSSTALNRSSVCTAVILLVVLVVGIIYAAPNLFGYDPAVQVSGSTPGTQLSHSDLSKIESSLKQSSIPYKSVALAGKSALVRFTGPNQQLAAKNHLADQLGDKYIVATLNVSATPTWLTALNARPMKLGLDLRGGMSLLLQVDVNDVIKKRQQNNVRDLAQAFRRKNIRYTAIIPSSSGVNIDFTNRQAMSDSIDVLSSQAFSQYIWQQSSEGNVYRLVGKLSPNAIVKIRQYTMQQTINTLNRRINELGLSEPQVQQQGVDRISVDLPGVSDATEAQDILGKTATVEAHLVDYQNDARQAESSGVIPAGDILLKDQQGNPVLLKSDVTLSGENITSASSSMSQAGSPQVEVQVGGSAQTKLYNVTSENVGKPMAVVYTEVKSHVAKDKSGKPKIHYQKISTVINIATINSAFGANFVIIGLSSPQAAKQLALLLRAGSLPAAVTTLSERQVGPSMGKQNVARGKLSVEIGFILVVLFMALYYRMMGMIANIALCVNLILIVAIMSLLGGVLTFPGIASLVLTIGMAVDANVLIFERIREELRNGTPIQTAIQSGYDRAVITIVDAQLTTLIAALVLFGIGSGPIKGFATVLTIGLFTSMLTSIVYTRVMVNFLYGGKRLRSLSIGIKICSEQGR